MLLRISSMAGYRNVRWAFLGMGLATLLAGFALLSSHSAGPASPGTSHSGLARLPLSFEPNAGQTDEAVRFMAHAPGGTLFFTDAGVVLSLETANAERVKQVQTQPGQPDKTRAGRSVTRIDFPGANPGTHLSGRQSLPGRTNYIKGKDRSQWHTNLPTYGSVTYSGLYTGIDLSYEGDAGQLKGTFTVAPGADPSLIRW